jgi:DNA invertase Pin-like site-specific DNA recombinase
MKKCVIYARVSSKEQEKGGFSIPAQIDFLTDYAKENKLDIVKVFTESETAKKAGRTNFNKMVELLKKNSEIKIILVEKTDRIYRNFKDYVTLDEFDGLEVHLVKENMIISDNAPSHIKFMHGMKVLMAKNYIDNLSEEVRKGINKKCKLGQYPAKAPIGYKNIIKNKIHLIEIDKDVEPYIKLAFELYVSTNHSFKSLAEELTKRGFRINGKPCRKNNIANIFDNPIYYGDFYHNGILYNGIHEPIISKELFLAVQHKRKALENPKKIKHDFTYSGIIKCSHCGCLLVGEIKKQKYIYYHCTGNKGGECKKKYIREEIIDSAVMGILEQLYVSPEDHEKIISTIKEMIGVKEDTESTMLDTITKQIKVLKNRLNCLYIDKIDGKITEEFFNDKSFEWNKEISELEIEMNALLKNEDTFLADCQNLLELCENASAYYKTANVEQKQKLLKLLCSNFFYDGENLHIHLKSTFETLFKSANRNENLGQGYYVRTFARNLISLFRYPTKENIYFLESLKIFQSSLSA